MSFLSLLVLSREKASVEMMKREREEERSLQTFQIVISHEKYWNSEIMSHTKRCILKSYLGDSSSYNMHFKPPKMMFFEASL